MVFGYFSFPRNPPNLLPRRYHGTTRVAMPSMRADMDGRAIAARVT
jgi:hypothetical protein